MGEIINMKHVKEKISYEFDIDSFEINQAYKITLPSIGLLESEFIGILTYVDSSGISFVITKDEERPEILSIGDTSISYLSININDYITGNISILKLGVVEDET